MKKRSEMYLGFVRDNLSRAHPHTAYRVKLTARDVYSPPRCNRFPFPPNVKYARPLNEVKAIVESEKDPLSSFAAA